MKKEPCMDEQLLVKRAKRGNVDAFGMLYEKYYKKMYAYALYLLKNPQDAEDVVSQAVMEAYQTIGQLRKDAGFSGWMGQIVANHCKRKMRDYYRQEEALTGERMEEQSYEKEKKDLSEERMDLRAAFYTLTCEEQTIVCMHAILGYTTKEIAQYLQENENTVRSKKSRALKKLAQKLQI